MKKKTILNICMVLTIILVAVCGIMAVGSVKGWFGEEEASGITVAEKSGIAMIERSGVSYEVTVDTAVRSGDRLYTKNGSTLAIADTEKARIRLDGNAEISIADIEKSMTFEVLQGDALVDARGLENITVRSGETEMKLDGAVASVSTQAGASMVYVYAGEVCVSDDTVEAGQVATIIVKNGEFKVTSLGAGSLSDAQMAKLAKCGMDDTFCFTEADLKKVQAEREAEILRAQQELLARKEAKAQARADEEKKNASVKTGTVVSGTTSSQEDPVSEEIAAGAAAEETYWEEEYYEPEEEAEDTSMYCTIEIVCDTILDNMENLTSGKEGYVPSSGTILGTSEVAFEDGETVFDVLQRVCDETGIQIEYSYTPIYESYYIEGINHLYEFDCGNESGWMYKVNGWFPNYGCSSYELEDGDTIVWCYTCNGLGADVGGSNF